MKKSFYLFLLIYFLPLQYCIGFAIYQHESASFLSPTSFVAFPPRGSEHVTHYGGEGNAALCTILL